MLFSQKPSSVDIDLFKIFLITLLFSIFFSRDALAEGEIDKNETKDLPLDIIRVIKPGVFDCRVADYLIRMRAWGVGFPDRGQPMYLDSLSFTESSLIGATFRVQVKQEFDSNNIKLVDILLGQDGTSFSRLAIAQGFGWHLEKETNRYGAFVMAQMRAKRNNSGIWGTGHDFLSLVKNGHAGNLGPVMPSLLGNQGMIPTIRYWVTSFGKVHRPGCSFYERGRGDLTSRPVGENCRICGGTK